VRNFTDEEHKLLDARVMNIFNVNQKHNEELDLPALLVQITAGDSRLQSQSSPGAEELLAANPSLRKLLQEGWKEGTFRKIRQLSMSLDLTFVLY
jgi:hypothetical protein